MAKKVKVQVEVDSNADEASDKFTRLQTQIRDTRTALQAAQAAGDQVTFKKLKAQLDELEDSLEINTLKSRQFDDALAAIPGPAGKVGGAIKGLDAGFKTLVANPIVAVIAGLAAVLTTIYAALKRTTEGQEALNKISEAFGRILTPIINFISATAVPVVELFAKGIDLVAGAFAKATGKAKEYNQQVANDAAANKAEENAKKIEKLLNSEGFKYDEFTRKKIEADLNYNKKLAEINRGTESEKEKARLRDLAFQEKQKAIQDANLGRQKVIDDAAAKALEKRNKENEQRLKDLEAAGKVETDAYLATLDERDKEVFQRGQKLNEDIAALEKAGIKDLTAVKEAYRIDVAKINKKYDDDEAKKAKEKSDKEIKEAQDKNKKLLDEEKTALDLKKAQGLISEDEYQAQLLQIRLKYSNSNLEQQQAEIDFLNYAKDQQKEYAEAIEEANKQMAQSWIDLGDTFGRTFSELAGLFEKGSAAQKVFGVVSVAINAATAIGKIKLSLAEQVADYSKAISTGTATIASGTALLSNPITAAVGAAQLVAGKAAVATATAGLARAKLTAGVQIGSVAVTSAAQIAAILAAKKSSTGATGGDTGGAGASAAPTPAFSGAIQAAAPIIGRSSVAPDGTLAGIVTEAVTRDRRSPIQAYVVGTQVSSQQELDRRITLAARMGG